MSQAFKPFPTEVYGVYVPEDDGGYFSFFDDKEYAAEEASAYNTRVAIYSLDGHGVLTVKRSTTVDLTEFVPSNGAVETNVSH